MERPPSPAVAPDAPPQPAEAAVQPPPVDSSWLPLYELERQSVDLIVEFLGDTERGTEEVPILRFLRSICRLCCTARRRNLRRGLDVFCQRYELAENIKALLEQEPMDPPRMLVWRMSMHTISELSSVQQALDGKEDSLLQTCFSGLFLVPPEQEMPYPGWCLYYVTLETMNVMIDSLVLNCPAATLSELLRSLFQMLLTFSNSDREYVRDRAMGRIERLSSVLAAHPTLRAWRRRQGDPHGPISYRDIHIPALGWLLGRLLIHTFEDKLSISAGNAVSNLESFLAGQNSRKHQAPQPPLEGALPATGVWSCARLLRGSERTDVVLVFIEAMRDASIFDKERARDLLGAVMEFPAFWLADVPKITKCICENLESITAVPARRSTESLLLLMADRSPGEVLTTLLSIAPPGDSSALDVWEVAFSAPHVLRIVKKFLGELRIFEVLYEQMGLATEQPPSAPMPTHELQPEDSDGVTHVQISRRDASLEIGSLVLRVLMGLSERPDVARKTQPLLPQVVGSLDYGSAETKRTVLAFLRNTTEREETRAVVEQLLEKLLPLFDDESVQLRELSMRLFGDLVPSLMGRDRKRVKRYVRRALLPLFFHLGDRSDCVAKAAGEALLGAAELLGWKQLQRLVQTQQTWRIGECLLQRDRSRAPEYLDQTLPYLSHAQGSVREAAVRFMGLAARPLRDRGEEEKVAEMCSALQPLEDDAEPSIRCLATQTILILCTPRERPRLRWSPRALCCWPR